MKMPFDLIIEHNNRVFHIEGFIITRLENKAIVGDDYNYYSLTELEGDKEVDIHIEEVEGLKDKIDEEVSYLLK